LKIGLNATCFNDRPSGAKQRFIGIYSELVKRLPNFEFIVYEPKDCRVGKWLGNVSNVSAKATPLPSEGRVRRFAEGFRYWGKELSQEQFDLFDVVNLPLIKAPTGKNLLTIHDIRGLRPESKMFERTAYRLFFESSLNAADHVITVSEAVKDEILTLYPNVPISVIYNGLDTSLYHNVALDSIRQVRLKYELPKDFILAVGHFEKRKNYLRLIEALKILRDRGQPCSLVIVGNNSGDRQEIEDKINSEHLSDYVTLLSGISDLELRCIYKLCSLFIFPSSYEGFGIPILEAMAAKRPMVLSDIPVFREITQNKGCYFPHNDPEAMSNAIEKVLSSSCDRSRLVKFGNERVQSFSFQSIAAQVETLYLSLA
jgi:glycosyltransferase involved in cell wall biosynthesis